MKYFTDPNAVEPPDMELLFPFVDSALPLAYGVLGILVFHVSGIFYFISLHFSLVETFTKIKSMRIAITFSLPLHCQIRDYLHFIVYNLHFYFASLNFLH